MKNRILKIVIWVVFVLLCLASGAVVSVAPYMWGERDGSGVLLWIFTVIPFLLLLLSALVCPIYNVDEIKKYVEPYKAVFLGSEDVFLLNFLLPFLMVRFDYFKEINTPIWMWLLYVCLPFIYGGISYFLFKYLSPKSDGELNLKSEGRETEGNVGEN